MSLINDALKRAKRAQQKNGPPTPLPGLALRPAEPARRKQSPLVMLLPLALIVLAGGSVLFIWFAMSAGGARPLSATVIQAKSVSTVAPAATAKRAALPAASERSPRTPVQSAGQVPTTKPATAQPASLPPEDVPPVNAPLAAPVHPEPDVQPRLPIVPATDTLVAVSDPSAASVTVESSLVTPITAPASSEPIATVTQTVVLASGPPTPPPLPKLQGIVYRPERPAALLDGKTVLVGRTSGDYRVVAINQQSVIVVRAGQTNVLEMPD